MVGAVGRAEARHGHGDDLFAVDPQAVEGAHADEQSEGGVESAADADDDRLGMGVGDAFAEAERLDVEDLLAGSPHVVGLRDEGVGIHFAQQLPLLLQRLRQYGLVDDAGVAPLLRPECALCIDIGAVATALGAQAVDVDLTHHQLWLQREPIRLLDKASVLDDQGVATIDHILRALSVATSAIYIARDIACALLLQEVDQVVVLAYQLVGGREIEDDVRPAESQFGARRVGCPYVLADLYAKARVAVSVEELAPGSQKHVLPRVAERRVVEVLGRGKPPFLIKLTVVGQKRFWHHAEDAPLLDDDGTVEQQVAHLDGCADDGDHVLAHRKLQEAQHRLLRPVDEGALAKQVLAGVAREGEFGEDDHLDMLALGLVDEALDLLQVVVEVCDAHAGDGGGHGKESVLHSLWRFI